MIFSAFKKNNNKVATSVSITKPSELDYQRLIDVSLVKLSALQRMGTARTERQILLVMEVLQRSLYSKSLQDYGQRKLEREDDIINSCICTHSISFRSHL